MQSSRMRNLKLSVCVLSALFLMVLGGCTASQNLDRYPRRNIDRPATLPEGVKSWGGSFWVLDRSDDFASATWREYQIPYVNRVGVTDRLTVHKLFLMLPLALQYEIARTERSFLSGGLGLTEFGYSSRDGWISAIGLGLWHRFHATSSFAWDSSVSADLRSGDDRDDRAPSVLRVAIGPIFQLHDALSAGLRGRLLLSESRRLDLFSSRFWHPSHGGMRTQGTVWITWNFHRQWDCSATYTRDGSGYENGYEGQSWNVGFTHFH